MCRYINDYEQWKMVIEVAEMGKRFQVYDINFTFYKKEILKQQMTMNIFYTRLDVGTETINIPKIVSKDLKVQSSNFSFQAKLMVEREGKIDGNDGEK